MRASRLVSLKMARAASIAALAAVGVLAAGTALAGYKTAYTTVGVSKNSDGSGYIAGHLSGARDSADSIQEVGCFLTARTSTGFRAGCRATDATGKSAVCYTTNTTMALPINAISADAAIWVAFDANGNCTEINIYNYSFYPTKAH
jgi:hypothetical protein